MSTQNPNPTPNPHPYAMPAPVPSTPFYRPANGRMLGGVCAAIADRFGWDRSLVRILAVATLFLAGTPILAYLVAWIIIPDEQKYWEQQAASAAHPPFTGYPQQAGYPTQPGTPAQPEA